jgi:hypothetical protein
MTATTTIVDHKIPEYHCNNNAEEEEDNHYAALIGPSSARFHGKENPPKKRQPRSRMGNMSSSSWGRKGRCRRGTLMGAGLAAASMLLLPYAAADCIPLTGSTTCSAFQNSQISTSDALTSN